MRKSGGNLHDPMRVQGALFYIIQEARDKNGHLYIEIGRLLKDTLKLLNEDLNDPLRLEQVEQQLAAMINLNVVVSNGGNIYLPQVYKQECEVALKIAQMVLELPKPVNLTPVMEQVKGRLGITLSPQQAEGVEMAFRYNLSIITGGPGTGKSTILRAVVEAYRMLYPQGKIALAAPTGKASRRMAETTGIEDAQTLHSLLKLFGDDSGGEKKKQSLEAGLLIVDETSMLNFPSPAAETDNPQEAGSADPANAVAEPSSVENMTEPAAAAETVPGQEETPPQTAPSYTEDMSVEEICQVMTMEEAGAIVVPRGPCMGWTMAQVAEGLSWPECSLAKRLTASDRKRAANSRVLREQEFEQMRQDNVIIYTGHLAGKRLVDVLTADLMEAAA